MPTFEEMMERRKDMTFSEHIKFWNQPWDRVEESDEVSIPYEHFVGGSDDNGYDFDEYSFFGDLEEPEIEPEPEVPAEPTTRSPRCINDEFGCRICPKTFKSKFTLELHLNRHKPKCINCNLEFKSWKNLKTHEKSCSRKFGIIKKPKRKINVPEKKRGFKCQLCFRTYTEHKHLYNHQVRRCKKRYVTSTWVQKI